MATGVCFYQFYMDGTVPLEPAAGKHRDEQTVELQFIHGTGTADAQIVQGPKAFAIVGGDLRHGRSVEESPVFEPKSAAGKKIELAGCLETQQCGGAFHSGALALL